MPSSASVSWTIKAKRGLQSALPGGSALEPVMGRIDRILAATFGTARVVVQDKMVGFRHRANQHVLLVDVCDGDEAGPYVVKIGPAAKLERELAGWQECRPVGLRHDMVFLNLSEGYRDPPETPEALLCLVYGDAQQFIGVSETLSLESAALDAVRLGVPAAASVRDVLVQLFERMGHLFYGGAAHEDDPGQAGFTFDLPRLDESLRAWETQEPLRGLRTAVHGKSNGSCVR